MTFSKLTGPRSKPVTSPGTVSSRYDLEDAAVESQLPKWGVNAMGFTLCEAQARQPDGGERRPGRSSASREVLTAVDHTSPLLPALWCGDDDTYLRSR